MEVKWRLPRLDGLAGYSSIGIRMLDDIAKYLRE